MKTPFVLLAAACWMVTANAAAEVVCADGVRRARCEEVRKPVPVVAEPRKEVVVEPAREVVAPKKEVEMAPECRMVEGRRVCR